jgi:CRISPR system Cascade subunit CasC
MTAPKFVQIHTLHSYPGILLNRDDAGLAKRLPFGGVERLRISSQCLKRHWARADSLHSLKGLSDAGLAVRSRLLWQEKVAKPLFAKGYPEDAVIATIKESRPSSTLPRKPRESLRATRLGSAGPRSWCSGSQRSSGF